MEKLNLNITGMHCASCAKLISEDLSETTGIMSSDISADTGEGKITFEQKFISSKEIIHKITSLGYGVTNEQ